MTEQLLTWLLLISAGIAVGLFVGDVLDRWDGLK